MPSLINVFLDKVIKSAELKNDAALSRALDVAPPVISKLRHERIAFGPSMAIKVHKLTGMTILHIEQESGVTF
jgi:plasmid maintenance system antidote protein VapI